MDIFYRGGQVHYRYHIPKVITLQPSTTLTTSAIADKIHFEQHLSVSVVGSCTNYRPLQHPNIKLSCNNDKGTTAGTTNDSPFSIALAVSHKVKRPRVVARLQ